MSKWCGRIQKKGMLGELAGEREIQNQLRLEEPRKQRSDLNLEFEKEDCSNLRES